MKFSAVLITLVAAAAAAPAPECQGDSCGSLLKWVGTDGGLGHKGSYDSKKEKYGLLEKLKELGHEKETEGEFGGFCGGEKKEKCRKPEIKVTEKACAGKKEGCEESLREIKFHAKEHNRKKLAAAAASKYGNIIEERHFDHGYHGIHDGCDPNPHCCFQEHRPNRCCHHDACHNDRVCRTRTNRELVRYRECRVTCTHFTAFEEHKRRECRDRCYRDHCHGY